MKKVNPEIILYGYDVSNLDKATKIICDFLDYRKVGFNGPLPKPNSRTLRSVLASPHKHHQAQRQFERIVHRRVIWPLEPLSSIKQKEWIILTEKIPHTIGIKFKVPKNI